MIHNYGHAIGMLDNNDADSVMSLNYLNQNNLALSADDVRGIQSLYGMSLSFLCKLTYYLKDRIANSILIVRNIILLIININ